MVSCQHGCRGVQECTPTAILHCISKYVLDVIVYNVVVVGPAVCVCVRVCVCVCVRVCIFTCMCVPHQLGVHTPELQVHTKLSTSECRTTALSFPLLHTSVGISTTACLYRQCTKLSWLRVTMSWSIIFGCTRPE